jgi:hypothetical protein
MLRLPHYPSCQHLSISVGQAVQKIFVDNRNNAETKLTKSTAVVLHSFQLVFVIFTLKQKKDSAIRNLPTPSFK